MKYMMNSIRTLLAFSFTFSALISAEEGMWLFNALPKDKIQKEYGVQLQDEWVEQIQKSCLRISSGGSGAFVSSAGLLMTNHHVGSTAIYQLSSENRNLSRDGYYADTYDKELKCPNLHVDQLISIRDVTNQVQSAFTSDMSPADKENARKVAIAAIKNDSKKETGLHPEIVIMYQGAQYHLYLYKRYTDVRLVMCPEESIAFFGGDPKNFEFPRHNLDVSFFRVYENNQPLETEHYLTLNAEGPRLNEPLFVAGHPGSTDRLYTAAHLSFQRDVELPLIMQLLKEKMAILQIFSAQSDENERIAKQDIFHYQNFYKVFKARSEGLLSSKVISNKQQSEHTFFQKLTQEEMKPWHHLNDTLNKFKIYYSEYFILEGIGSRYSKLFSWAKELVRAADERDKPNENRLREFTDTELPSLERDLYSTEPLYIELERALLKDSLQRLINLLGRDHPAVKSAMGTQSIDEKVEELLTTSISDLNTRKRLFENPSELENSTDPLIVFFKALDPYARTVRQSFDLEFMTAKKECYEKIIKTLFDKSDDSLYPDATFTLRLSYGSMIGYEENNTFIEPITKRHDVFDIADQAGNINPFYLPEKWYAKKDTLNKEVPFNFVSTNDIVGGNSGSPVVNQKGEIVGIIFDGNVHSLLWDYAFDQTQGRAVSVHAHVIIDSLEHIYGAESLVKELKSAGNIPNVIQ